MSKSLFAWLIRIFLIGALLVFGGPTVLNQFSSNQISLEVTGERNSQVTCVANPKLLFSIEQEGTYHVKIDVDGAVLLDKTETYKSLGGPRIYDTVGLPVQKYSEGRHKATLQVGDRTTSTTFRVKHVPTCNPQWRPATRNDF